LKEIIDLLDKPYMLGKLNSSIMEEIKKWVWKLG